MLIIGLGLALPLSLAAQDSIRRRVSRDYLNVVRTIQRAQKTLVPSRSIGLPNAASMEHAKALPAKGYGYTMRSALSRKTNFGTDEMFETTNMHFIHQRMTRAGRIAPSNAIVLHPFGRHCMGFKSAGEIT